MGGFLHGIWTQLRILGVPLFGLHISEYKKCNSKGSGSLLCEGSELVESLSVGNLEAL